MSTRNGRTAGLLSAAVGARRREKPAATQPVRSPVMSGNMVTPLAASATRSASDSS